jgi:hypothetical protein
VGQDKDANDLLVVCRASGYQPDAL